jgi:hypothetical protein
MIPTYEQLEVLRSLPINVAFSAVYNFMHEGGPGTLPAVLDEQLDQLEYHWTLRDLTHYMFPGMLSDGHLYYLSETKMQALIRQEYAEEFGNFLLEVAMSRA